MVLLLGHMVHTVQKMAGSNAERLFILKGTVISIIWGSINIYCECSISKAISQGNKQTLQKCIEIRLEIVQIEPNIVGIEQLTIKSAFQGSCSYSTT